MTKQMTIIVIGSLRDVCVTPAYLNVKTSTSKVRETICEVKLTVKFNSS